LSIAAFTRLCRELDIGAQYARHVREALGLDEPVGASALQHNVIASHAAALRSALHMARIDGDIAEDMWRALGELIEGKPALPQDDQPLRAHD
ncbi:dermonecrotic toxin domain-containing protein, partial [Pseudomonas viridiflava]|uniref:dermonecrotic toxin domain-containing protein n=1 Tax=Pseudomonas viridiflava TaxID=33069 RepID=UPI0013CEDE76